MQQQVRDAFGEGDCLRDASTDAKLQDADDHDDNDELSA